MLWNWRGIIQTRTSVFIRNLTSALMDNFCPCLFNLFGSYVENVWDETGYHLNNKSKQKYMTVVIHFSKSFSLNKHTIGIILSKMCLKPI